MHGLIDALRIWATPGEMEGREEEEETKIRTRRALKEADDIYSFPSFPRTFPLSLSMRKVTGRNYINILTFRYVNDDTSEASRARSLHTRTHDPQAAAAKATESHP
jgi:hypothetical protein